MLSTVSSARPARATKTLPGSTMRLVLLSARVPSVWCWSLLSWRPASRQAPSPGGKPTTLLGDFREGWHLVFDDPALRALVVLAWSAAVFLIAPEAVALAYAREEGADAARAKLHGEFLRACTLRGGFYAKGCHVRSDGAGGCHRHRGHPLPAGPEPEGEGHDGCRWHRQRAPRLHHSRQGPHPRDHQPDPLDGDHLRETGRARQLRLPGLHRHADIQERRARLPARARPTPAR